MRQTSTKPTIRSRIRNWFRGAPVATSNTLDFGPINSPNSPLHGARRDRLTSDWAPAQQGPNSIHRNGAGFLRDRARDLVLNEPLAKSAIEAYVANVVECGITPKPRLEDSEQRRAWMQAWEHWCAKEADLTGVQHFYELMSLWLEEVLVGGGCLLHFVQLPRKRGRRLPLAIEILPEERFADDFDTRRVKKSSDVEIINGIEIEKSTGMHLAYWIRPVMPNDVVIPTTYDPIRLPAEDCVYGFFRRRIGQDRGLTALRAAIQHLWKLGYFLDNEMMASAIASCFAVFIATEDGGGYDGLAGDSGAESTDERGNTFDRVEPGMVVRGRPGESAQGIMPNRPNSQAEPWIKLIQRSIATAAGLSYSELMRDTGDSSFSAVRAEANADRKRFRPLQRFTVNHFCQPIYERFVQAAVLAGLDGFPRPSDFVANMDEWLACSWRPPGWASVTPLEDAKAAEVEIKLGVSTREQYIGNRGGDWEETFEQLQREEDLADERELTIQGTKAAMEAENPQPVEAPKDGQ